MEFKMNEPRNVVTFRCPSFNTTQQKEKFINGGNFGDDVAEWVATELEKRGAKVDREDDFPGQEDFGWYVDFQLGESPFTFVIGHRPEEDGSVEWVGWMERQCGLVGSLFGGRNRRIDPQSVETIHSILKARTGITAIRWHLKADFDKGIEDKAAEQP
jgi:hypothetical protein